MENQLLKSSNEIEKVKYKMKQMKQVLVTLSMDAPIIQVDKYSSKPESTRYQPARKSHDRKDYHEINSIDSPIILPPTSEEQKQSAYNRANNESSAISTSSILSSSPPSPPSMRLSSPDPVAPTISSPDSKKRISAYRERLQNAPVDFENILNEIFASKASNEMGHKTSSADTSPSKSSISLTEVDIRLAELEKEKKRLRKLLVTNL
jgi:hypothetical protein